MMSHTRVSSLEIVWVLVMVRLPYQFRRGGRDGSPALVVVYAAQDFGDGGKCSEGNFAVELDRSQYLGEVRVLADLDAAIKGDFQGLAGDGRLARSDHARQISAP